MNFGQCHMGTHPTSKASVRTALAGAWSLESWQIIEGDGHAAHPLGEHPVGQLMYDDATGTVSAQLVAASQPCFASDDGQEATSTEMIAAWPRYLRYFGTFTLDEPARTVTHHIIAG